MKKFQTLSSASKKGRLERMNHCLLLLAAVFAALPLLLSSCKSSKSPAEAAETSSLLWKVSGNGLEKPSYLFGTIHMICPDDFFMPDAAKTAFANSEQLVLELDMDDPNLQMEMQKGIMMDGGKNLKSLLSEEEYQEVARFFQDSLGIPEQQFGMMAMIKPFMLSSMMTSKMLNCEQPQSYEGEFVKMALGRKMEVLGLEEVSEQLAVFDRISYEDQAEMLHESIENFDKSKDEFQQLVATYKKQDVSAAYEQIQETSAKYENYEEELLTKRNRNWIPVITDLAKQKSTFFAVGAGHLGGNEGVLALLRQAGYTVEPMK